jgi:hypothetical protein
MFKKQVRQVSKHVKDVKERGNFISMSVLADEALISDTFSQ